MNNPTKIIRSKKEQLKIEIPAAPSWDGFDEITIFLVEEYNAFVLNKIDGFLWRKWVFEIDKKKFELIHDEMDGNYLQAPEEGEPIILQIGQVLEERLMGDLFELEGGIKGRVLKTKRSAILTFWHNNSDVTGKIYKKLDSQKWTAKELQLFGAPFSYELLMIPLKHLDELLCDLKTMDKDDLRKHWYDR